ncbi:MAG: hypothetical protein HFK07_01475 [Clostridia bacterium]|jgi:hypothetical protein|nr:hypothetical protein [Clostridia bacterium]MCX4367124.1 hypothetical protein [Clostridia bacterium]
MKKRFGIALLVLIVIVSVFAFSACTSDKGYQRYFTNMDDLKKAMGDEFRYPTVELKNSDEFYDEAKYKNDVLGAPQSAKANSISILYIPPLSADKYAELLKETEVKFDENAYRYSIKLTMNDAYGDVYKNNGDIEYYIYGSDFRKATGKGTENVKRASLEDRKNKLDSDNKSDKKKLESIDSELVSEGKEAKKYYACEIIDINGISAVFYENKIDSQIVYYILDGDDFAYELTAYIAADAEKDKNSTEHYDALRAEAKSQLLKFISSMFA